MRGVLGCVSFCGGGDILEIGAAKQLLKFVLVKASGLRDGVRGRLASLLRHPVGRPSAARVAAGVLVVALAAGIGWGAYAFFAAGFVFPQVDLGEMFKRTPPPPDELTDEEAREALRREREEAVRLRDLNRAVIAADRYQRRAWEHTLRDIHENEIRMKEKQRLSEAEEAERLRLANLRKQQLEKEAQEAARLAAENAALARSAPQFKQKRRMRTFETPGG